MMCSPVLDVPAGTLVARFEDGRVMNIDDDDERSDRIISGNVPTGSLQIDVSHVPYLRQVPHSKRMQIKHCDQLELVDKKEHVVNLVDNVNGCGTLVEIEKYKDGFVFYGVSKIDVCVVP